MSESMGFPAPVLQLRAVDFHILSNYLRSMTVTEAPFSDLINKPKATLEPLVGSRAHAIWLRRRDEGDLVLTTAHRYEQEHAVVQASVRVLTELVRLGQPDLIRRVVASVFPWVTFLPGEDQEQFSTELIDILRAAEDIDNLAPVAQLIREWRTSAEIYADPELLAVLTRDADDLGPVTEPPAAG